MPAARRMELDRISLLGECPRHRGVVRIVVLVEGARDRRRDRASLRPVVEDGADEAVDVAEAGKTRLPGIRSAPEVAARLEEETGEGPGLEPVGMEEGKSAEARAEPHATPAAAARDLVERRCERPRKGLRSGVGLHPV